MLTNPQNKDYNLIAFVCTIISSPCSGTRTEQVFLSLQLNAKILFLKIKFIVTDTENS